MSHDHPHPEPGETRPSQAPGPTPAAPSSPAGGPALPLEDAGTQALAEALRSSFGIVKFLMLALLGAFVVSGIYTVQPNEQAVLLRFGRPVGVGRERLLEPGPHWKLPYPIDEVVTIPVRETRTATSTAGWYYVTPEEELAGGKNPDSALPALQPGVDGYTLTSDGNIVHVRATVNYRITDPLRYAFEFTAVTNLLQQVLDNALYYAASRFSADDALYRRRAAFQECVLERANRTVDRLGLGVTLDPREVRIDAPLFVQRAFSQVLEAQQKADTRVREAEAYARGATNRALGEASVIRQDGLTLSNTLVRAVATDATNFLGLLPAWERDRHLLRERLVAETAQRVMTNAQFKTFLPERADGRPRELRLLLNKEPEAPARIEAAPTR